jgi:hypothetical protein
VTLVVARQPAASADPGQRKALMSGSSACPLMAHPSAMISATAASIF